MDLLLTAGWVAVLIIGGGACALLHGWGLPRTYVRDLLHVGAGVWPLGWQAWSSPWNASALPVVALLALSLLPRLERPRAFSRFREAISDDDERWSGILLYVLSFAVLTPVGLLRTPFAAAAALLALSLGDGLGGLIGRRFGRTRFQLPFAKPKSLEGTLAVFFAAAVGIAIASAVFRAPIAPVPSVAAAMAAAAAEAVAPRASDNILVPAAVWLTLVLL